MCVDCGITPAQKASKHKGRCGKCSTTPKKMCVCCGTNILECPYGITPARGGLHGDRCIKHTLRVPSIQLLDDTVDSLTILVGEAAYWLRQNNPADPEWIQKYVLHIAVE